MKYYKNESLMCPIPLKREQMKEIYGIGLINGKWINSVVDRKICLNYE